MSGQCLWEVSVLGKVNLEQLSQYNMKKKTIKIDLQKLAQALQAYENKWVALVGNKVVAAGESVQEVKQKAEAAGHSNYMFHLVPPSSVLLAP